MRLSSVPRELSLPVANAFNNDTTVSHIQFIAKIHRPLPIVVNNLGEGLTQNNSPSAHIEDTAHKANKHGAECRGSDITTHIRYFIHAYYVIAED